jgi:hypothetical protein
MNRLTRAGALAVSATVLMSGCGFGQKSAATKRIIKAASVVDSAGTVTGRLELMAKLTKLNGQSVTRTTTPPPGPAGAPTTTAPPAKGNTNRAGGIGAQQVSPPIGVQVDFTRDRAEMVPLHSGTPGQASPLVIYSHWSLYRYSAPAKAPAVAAEPAAPTQPAAPNADDSEADVPRVWTKLDFASIDPKARATLQNLTTFPSVSPSLLVRFLKGALTGSVKTLGQESIDGVPTTHYRFNIDRDKAVQGMHDKDKQIVTLLLQRSGFTGSVFRKAEVWLDDQGRARRLVIHFHQAVGRSDAADIGFRLTLSDFGKPVAIELPIADAISTVADYPQLVAHV